MEKIKDHLILFDLDGILIDSLSKCIPLFYRIMESDLGLKHHESIGKEIYSLTREKVVDLEWKDDIQKRGIPAEAVQAAIQHYRSEKGKLEFALLPGVRSCLEMIRDFFEHLAVVSNNPQAVIESILLQTGIRPFFHKITGIEGVTHHKPHPEMLEKTARYFNVAPQQCLIFEDSGVGIQAAKNAGMKAIAVATGMESSEELGREAPDHLVKTLGDVTVDTLFQVFGLPG